MSPSSLPSRWEADLAAARSGSRDALDRLFDRSWRYLVKTAHQLLPAELRSKLDAADLAQETALKAFRSFTRFVDSTETEWLAWLRIILIRTIQDLVRDRQRSKRAAKEVSLDEAGPKGVRACPDQAPGEQAMQAEAEALLQNALAGLPELSRWVVLFRTYFGLSHAEVGQLLDLSANAVQKHWSQALRALKDSGLVTTIRPE